ncbi:MAG: histidine phosphatase family protein [Chloroflexota bacterium]
MATDAGTTIPDGLDATLVLLRHGETEFIVEGRFQGQSETPLSPVGRRQAELAGDRLARPGRAPVLPVPAVAPLEIVHSPLARTAQTAEIAAAAIAEAAIGEADGDVVRLRPEPGFVEIGQGQWEGLLRSEIETRYGPELSAWRRQPVEAWAPGGESLSQVQARVRPALRSTLDRLADGRAPGTPDRPQVAGYATVVPDQPWTLVVGHDGVFKVLLITLLDLPLESFWAWSFDLAGISVIELRGGRPVLRAHGLTEHLAPLLDERAKSVSEARERSGAL